MREMRETYFVEMLMKMVRAGMSSPQFICSNGMKLKVFAHEIMLSVPKYEVVDSGNGNATPEQPTGYTEISLTADQLACIIYMSEGLCKTVSALKK